MSNKVTITLGNDGQWVCSPDPIPVREANVNLTFLLSTPGYSFASTNAIVVHDGGSEFPDPSVTKDATTAKLRDKNSKAGRFKYDVNLVRDSDKRPVVIDPTIENQPK
ncbi:MAG: hypothetical protein AB1430_23295 [Pseudomonadota bacterium]